MFEGRMYVIYKILYILFLQFSIIEHQLYFDFS